MRVFSFGGGVQSMAVLVLAAQGAVRYDAFLFANVGDDSENPETLVYLGEYAMPYARRHGIALIELHKTLRDGSRETLLGRIGKTRSSLPLPVRMQNGAPGNRTCTADFKIRVVAKWLRANGATPDNPATVGLGISTDELHRARTDSGIPYEMLEYPLLDLRLNRNDCERLIREAGLPVPPKSSCWFCPFHRVTEWRRLKHDRPDLFAASVALEERLNERRATLGKDRVWLTQYGRPLDQVVAGDQMTLDDAMDTCDSGYCFV